MRIRAGVVLIEDGKVALIERFRNGNHYYVFPGGGADDGESAQEAAIREMEEETGLRVVVKREVAEIRFDLSTQHYFLAKRISGEYGTGTGEEFTDADPDDPAEGIYIPIWMPLKELSDHENIYPADIKELVLKSVNTGWPNEPVVILEPMK
jgi:8-oxo-dGTP pyrophosphatase MutT (NUDIX family)